MKWFPRIFNKISPAERQNKNLFLFEKITDTFINTFTVASAANSFNNNLETRNEGIGRSSTDRCVWIGWPAARHVERLGRVKEQIHANSMYESVRVKENQTKKYYLQKFHLFSFTVTHFPRDGDEKLDPAILCCFISFFRFFLLLLVNFFFFVRLWLWL